MSLPDTNTILRTYLTTSSALVDPLIALVGDKIFCPRAPENATLPNITFFTRGGRATPYIPDLPSPSVQIDCWADDSIEAREIYRALYDALQGIQNVIVGSNTILSAIEEIQGQDLVDIDIPGRFRVLSFWEIMIK
jgi:hypothetical protein